MALEDDDAAETGAIKAAVRSAKKAARPAKIGEPERKPTSRKAEKKAAKAAKAAAEAGEGGEKKEQKKMRKQRRQAELQDKRDRIRMGLIPPDPPKGRSTSSIALDSR